MADTPKAKKGAGAAAGAAGSVLGDLAQNQFPNKLAVAGFDLTRHVGAALGGLAGAMVAGEKDWLKGIAVGVAGDAAGLLIKTVVPQIPDFAFQGVSTVKAVSGAGVGYFVIGAL